MNPEMLTICIVLLLCNYGFADKTQPNKPQNNRQKGSDQYRNFGDINGRQIIKSKCCYKNRHGKSDAC